MDLYQKYLDPQTLARAKDLELRARRTIEGLVSGAHRSPYQGVSVEFAEHREYTPGDDVRHVDWKVFGKTDKFYLKRYEQETNLVCNLVCDTSQSMGYASQGESKLEYAAKLTACLAYLVLHQQDSVGLTLFENRIRYLVPPSGQATHLKQILHLLAVCQPSNYQSRIGDVLDELAGRLRKRSLVMILSDGFDDVDRIAEGLRHLRYKRHEIVLFHILDRAELEFPFQDMTLFRGLEEWPELLVEPRSLRDAYQSEFQSYRRDLLAACRESGVDYQEVVTDQPLDLMVSSYLSRRAGRYAG